MNQPCDRAEMCRCVAIIARRRECSSAQWIAAFALAGIFITSMHRSLAADAPPAAAPAKYSAAAPGADANAIDGKKFHALLVGCTKYDNLSQSKWLNGPANDVDLMRRFFTDRLKLPAQSIVVLSEPEAAARGADFRPTRANIEREIKKLIATAQAGDQVVLLLAGHGGQQPEHKDPDPMYAKPDGLDQMFLPCDCGHWISRNQSVERAIVDYELRNWCKQITFKKARLWVVLDACCSGWTLRDGAPSGTMVRNLSADDLGIPKPAIDKARDAAQARQAAGRGSPSSRGNDNAPNGEAEAPAIDFGPQSLDYVGIYAAQRDESELEMPMPYGGETHQPQRVQGLLTYAIVDILSRASRPITYGELANLVRQRYPQWGRTTGPTPVVEGLAQDRVVLGVQRWTDRSRQRWQKLDSRLLSVNEGSVEGMTPGSIVALHPPIDQPNAAAVLGYAELTDCNLLDSDAKFAKYNGARIPRMDALPAGGTFEIIRTDFGSLRVKLGVDPQPLHTVASPAADAAADAAATASLHSLAAPLKVALAQHGSLCEFVDDPNSAAWVVQKRDGKLNLLSKDAAQIRGKTPPEAPRFSVAANDTASDIVRRDDANRPRSESPEAERCGAKPGGCRRPRRRGRRPVAAQCRIKTLEIQKSLRSDRQRRRSGKKPADAAPGRLCRMAHDESRKIGCCGEPVVHRRRIRHPCALPAGRLGHGKHADEKRRHDCHAIVQDHGGSFRHGARRADRRAAESGATIARLQFSRAAGARQGARSRRQPRDEFPAGPVIAGHDVWRRGLAGNGHLRSDRIALDAANLARQRGFGPAVVPPRVQGFP